jgi:anti-sigma factor RsiW
MAGESRVEGVPACERARQWASSLLDGELSELEQAMLGRHLGSCAACRGWLAAAETATALLRAAPLERPSRSVAPAVRADSEVSRRARISAVAAAALVLGAGLAGSFLTGSGGREAPAPAPELGFLDEAPGLRGSPGSGQVTPPEPEPPVTIPREDAV